MHRGPVVDDRWVEVGKLVFQNFKLDFWLKIHSRNFSRIAERRARILPPIAAKTWPQLPKLSALGRFAQDVAKTSKEKNQKKFAIINGFVTVSGDKLWI